MLRPVDGGVHAQHPQRAVGHRRDAADHAHGRGLAGTVGTQEAERFARRDLEVDGVHGGGRAESLGQAARKDKGLGRADRTPAEWYRAERCRAAGQDPDRDAGQCADACLRQGRLCDPRRCRAGRHGPDRAAQGRAHRGRPGHPHQVPGDHPAGAEERRHRAQPARPGWWLRARPTGRPDQSRGRHPRRGRAARQCPRRPAGEHQLHRRREAAHRCLDRGPCRAAGDPGAHDPRGPGLRDAARSGHDAGRQPRLVAVARPGATRAATAAEVVRPR